jgi:pyruvate,water dikinase
MQWMGGVLMGTLLGGLRDDQKVANAARAGRPDLSKLTDQQLIERARSFNDTIRHMFDVHLEVTAGTSIGSGILTAVAAGAGDPTLALKLMTSVGDVDSAAPSHAMWALSRLDANSDEFKKGFTKFLEEFGSRAPNEWDIRSETWETKPELALALIDVMRKSPDDDNPEKRNAVNAAQREAITTALRAGLADQPEVLGQFDAGLASAHAYLAARERAKTNIIKVIHEVRMAIRELASRHNYSMSQTCMLLNDELDAFVADPESFRARLTAREEQYLALFEYEPPFIVHKEAPPMSTWKKKGEEKFAIAKSGDVLSGVPGCPGVARGRARVVLDPSDPFALEPGDVLIAPITDPAWTPLFVPAGAVVVNVGAQVSHAVIVSRELGIPCVVSVQGATESIPDGAMVEVNGDAGTVTLL